MKSLLILLLTAMAVSFAVSVDAAEIFSPNYRAPDGNDYFIGHNFSGVKITDEILDGYNSLTFKVENTTNQNWIWVSIPNSLPIQDDQAMPAVLKFNGHIVEANYDKHSCSYGKSFVITSPSVIEIDFLYDEKNMNTYHYAILNKECDMLYDKLTFQNESASPRHGYHIWTMPPLKQFKAGVPLDEIQCKEGFVFAQHTSTGNPLCLKPHTKEILAKRGVIELPPPYSPYPDHN